MIDKSCQEWKTEKSHAVAKGRKAGDQERKTENQRIDGDSPGHNICQHSDTGSAPFSALEFEKDREAMSQHRCSTSRKLNVIPMVPQLPGYSHRGGTLT